jgi:hypothetical protein
MSTYVIPIFTAIAVVTFKIVENEITSLANFWNNILWPALNKTWTFLNTYVIPLFGALANIWIALVKRELQAMADAWNNQVLPAITAVSNWFSDHIAPALNLVAEKLGLTSDKINNDLGPAFQWLSDHVLQPVAGWFTTIGDKIQSLIGWLNDLADKINNLPSIPGPFKGGSPPPLANWMGMIADQTHRAAIGFGALNAPMTAMPSSPMAMMAAGNTTNMTNNNQRSVNLNYNTTYAPPASTSLAIANALGAY